MRYIALGMMKPVNDPPTPPVRSSVRVKASPAASPWDSMMRMKAVQMVSSTTVMATCSHKDSVSAFLSITCGIIIGGGH